MAVLEFQIDDASPEVQIDDITLLFDNGLTTVDITADIMPEASDILTSTTVRYNLIGILDEDEGNYTLIASNPSGIDQATIALTIQGMDGYKNSLIKVFEYSIFYSVHILHCIMCWLVLVAKIFIILIVSYGLVHHTELLWLLGGNGNDICVIVKLFRNL